MQILPIVHHKKTMKIAEENIHVNNTGLKGLNADHFAIVAVTCLYTQWFSRKFVQHVPNISLPNVAHTNSLSTYSTKLQNGTNLPHFISTIPEREGSHVKHQEHYYALQHVKRHDFPDFSL